MVFSCYLNEKEKERKNEREGGKIAERRGERKRARDYIARFEREFDPLLESRGPDRGLALGYRESIYVCGARRITYCTINTIQVSIPASLELRERERERHVTGRRSGRSS